METRTNDFRLDENEPRDVATERHPQADAPAGPGFLRHDTVPQLARVDALWTRPVRIAVVTLVLVATAAYVLFGTVLARNVTFNRLVDPGAKNGIPRFVRESVMSIWQTMWDRAPAFGSIDLTRMVLLISTVVFFLAFAFIVVTVFVPSRREWSSALDDGQTPDASPGD